MSLVYSVRVIQSILLYCVLAFCLYSGRVCHAQSTLCARVGIQLEQEAVISRSAFRATLTVRNDGSGPLTGLGVVLDIRDPTGTLRNDSFAIGLPEVSGLGDVGGNGALSQGGQGSATWLIVPRDDAAPSSPLLYSFGGTLQYTVNGSTLTIPMEPARLTVFPNPRLRVKYFWEKYVYSDDPFTPAVEPARPFAVGLMMSNVGAGVANNVRITTAQPEIKWNDRDLLINFQLNGTQVGDQAVTPSLTVNLGNIGPSQTRVARYLLTSSLQGRFTNYSARYQHLDQFGGIVPSLIEDGYPQIFELIHSVKSQELGADNVPDFLTNELSGADDPAEVPSDPALADLPDRLHQSDGTVSPVTTVTSPSVQITGTSTAMVNAGPASDAWRYIVFDSPFAGNRLLREVRRSDGRVILAGDNAYQTDRIFRPAGFQVIYRSRIHIFDKGGPGLYTVSYIDAPVLPSQVSGWNATAPSGVGQASIDIPLGQGHADSRVSGPTSISFTATQPLNPATFVPRSVSLSGRSLDGQLLDLSAFAISTGLSPDGRSGTLSFISPLPAKARYCLNLVGVTDIYGRFLTGQTRLNFSILPGDVSGNSVVDYLDVNNVLTLIGSTVNPSVEYLVRADFNGDGRINDRDLELVTSVAGQDLRWIADPCFGSLLGNGGDPNATQPPPARIFNELEPNSSKVSASSALAMTYRDTITGSTTGASIGQGPNSIDYHVLSPAALPAGIYRNRLQLTTPGTDAFTTSIRGKSQANGAVIPASDVVVQTVAPPITGLHYNQWYNFGQSSEIYYTVSGTPATTDAYSVTLKTEPITPVVLGKFSGGLLSIATAGRGHNTDTEIMVFTTSGVPVLDAQSDDRGLLSPGSQHAALRSNFGGGSYFVAISDRNLASNMPDSSAEFAQPMPVLDNVGNAIDSSAATNLPLDFSITDVAGVVRNFTAIKKGKFDIYWGVFSMQVCIADIASDSLDELRNPNGFVGAEDLDAFIAAFISENVSLADVASDSLDILYNPNGVVGPEDLDAFLAAFVRGC